MTFRSQELADLERTKRELREAQVRESAALAQVAELRADIEVLREKLKDKPSLWVRFEKWREDRALKKQRLLVHYYYKPSDFFPKLVLVAVAATTLGLVVWGLIALASANPITAGYIIGKTHAPASVSTTTDSEGTLQVSTTPESWSILIGADNHTRNVTVSEERFNRVRQGQWYCVSNSRCVEPNRSE